METSSLSLENESQPFTLLDEQRRSTLSARKEKTLFERT